MINEKQKDQGLTVNIKVDIVAQTQQCLGSQFPKSVRLAAFNESARANGRWSNL